MSRLIYFFQVLILFLYYQKCKGMTEVFGWNQMDYYNRGDNNQLNGYVNPPNYNNNRYPSKLSMGERPIVFPDQYASYRRKYKRQQSKITSRDDIPKTDLRFGRPNVQQSNNANGSYIPYNNVPMGATHYKGRLFITMPRRRIGIPSTLNYIDMIKDGTNPSPKLRAFPDFETNQFNLNGDNTNKLVSVYRTSVDECGRLWFIDTGMLEYPDNRIQLKRPTIWIIDLNNNRVVKQFEIPVDIAETGRGLASITVDNIDSKCQQAYAYIPDLLYNRLYVYSFDQDRIWSFSHNYFNFDPVAGDLNIGGQSFRWDDGIFSITLGFRKINDERDVYFHPMASNNEFIVSNKVLQNETNAARSDHGNDFRLLGSRGMNAQSTMHEYDPLTGNIFYAEIQRNGVGCWNTNKRFSAENHDSVFQDEQRMIYPSDLTIDGDGTIWVMSNTMPVFIYSTLDTNVVNFRVWKQNVFDAVQGTRCSVMY